jgi:hypothetical protein
MPTEATPPPAILAATLALRRVLSQVRDPNTIADLLYLERWEIRPLPSPAAVLRIKQIRRANPDLAAAIRAELAGKPFMPSPDLAAKPAAAHPR